LPAAEYVRVSLFGVYCAELNLDFSMFSCHVPFQAFESDFPIAGCGSAIAVAARINANLWDAFMAILPSGRQATAGDSKRRRRRDVRLF
jgi:hypothetical protein